MVWRVSPLLGWVKLLESPGFGRLSGTRWGETGGWGLLTGEGGSSGWWDGTARRESYPGFLRWMSTTWMQWWWDLRVGRGRRLRMYGGMGREWGLGRLWWWMMNQCTNVYFLFRMNFEFAFYHQIEFERHFSIGCNVPSIWLRFNHTWGRKRVFLLRLTPGAKSYSFLPHPNMSRFWNRGRILKIT